MSEREFRYEAIVTRVIDGDTLELSIDLGFRTWTLQPIRVRGVNCPELPTPEGEAARVFVYELVEAADFVVDIQSFHDRRSFARWVADVWINGELLADTIIAAGHGEVMR